MNVLWKFLHICREKRCWRSTYYKFGRKPSLWCAIHTVKRLFETFKEMEVLAKAAGK